MAKAKLLATNLDLNCTLTSSLAPTFSFLDTIMKTISLILLLSAYSASAQDLTIKIDGFLDIPWGATADTVKKTFPSKSRARLDQIKSKPGEFVFTGGKFAKFKVRRFTLEFINDRFWNAHVRLEPVSKDHAKEHATLKQLLSEKYGAPSSDEVRSGNLITNWHVGPGPEEKERIEIQSDPDGDGLKIMYASDRFRKTLQAGSAPEVAKTTKPISAAPGAKDDL